MGKSIELTGTRPAESHEAHLARTLTGMADTEQLRFLQALRLGRFGKGGGTSRREARGFRTCRNVCCLLQMTRIWSRRPEPKHVILADDASRTGDC